MMDQFDLDGSPLRPEQQQTQVRPKNGLQPTNAHDAYKRSSARSSRRSRAERTSYLVATGHLEPEETIQLHVSGQEFDSQHDQLQLPVRNNCLENESKINRGYRNPLVRESATNSYPRAEDIERTLLDDSNNTRADQLDTSQSTDIFKQPKIKGIPKKQTNNKLSPYVNQSVSRFSQAFVSEDPDEQHSRGRFSQTFTEVSLPMKTSPAFEYILKDNRRRNKRYLLWLLYSTLVIICLAMILFSGIHLLIRF